MVIVWCERGFFHAHICLCEEKIVPSDAACYDNSYLTMFERIAYHSPESTAKKCSLWQ